VEEKEIQLSEEDKEYKEEYNKLFDKVKKIKNIILSSEKEKESSKVLKTSRKKIILKRK
jgi:hypothetical protein